MRWSQEPRLKSRPDPPRSSTPEPPWHSTSYNRPPWQPTIPAAPSSRATRAASSGRTTPPKAAASSGRTTPPKAPRPKGADSVPAPAPAVPAAPARQAAARASTMSSSLRSSASLTQSIRSSTSQVQAHATWHVGISKDVGRTCVDIFCVVLLFLLFIIRHYHIRPTSSLKHVQVLCALTFSLSTSSTQ